MQQLKLPLVSRAEALKQEKVERENEMRRSAMQKIARAEFHTKWEKLASTLCMTLHEGELAN